MLRFYLQIPEPQDDHLVDPRVRGTGKKSFTVYPVEALITGTWQLFIPFRATLSPDTPDQ